MLSASQHAGRDVGCCFEWNMVPFGCVETAWMQSPGVSGVVKSREVQCRTCYVIEYSGASLKQCSECWVSIWKVYRLSEAFFRSEWCWGLHCWQTLECRVKCVTLKYHSDSGVVVSDFSTCGVWIPLSGSVLLNPTNEISNKKWYAPLEYCNLHVSHNVSKE